MSKKVAKLVDVSLRTRVIVDKNATEDEIIQQSKQKFIDTINTSLGDNIEDIEDDDECPYDPEYD